MSPVAVGDTVILEENDSNGSTITMQIPKKWYSMTVYDSVEWQCHPRLVTWSSVTFLLAETIFCISTLRK